MQANGSTLVGARLGTAGSGQAESLPGLFLVTPSDVARRASEVRISTANDFFISSRPADAGALNLQAQQLALNGSLGFAAAQGENGRGGELNVAAPRIVVGNVPAELAAGALLLDIGQLNRSGASSVLLGGTRASAPAPAPGAEAGSRLVTAFANKVILGNGDTSLRLGDLSLVALDSISVLAGASVVPEGEGSATELHVLGDGAGLRVNAGSGELLRTPGRAGAGGAAKGTAGETAAGQLTIGAGAQLGAGNLTAEATGRLNLDPTALLRAGQLTLGAPGVRVGAPAAAGSNALVLTGHVLADINAAQALTLRSYGIFELAAGSVLGGFGMQALQLQAGQIHILPALDSAAGPATVLAQAVTLFNPNGSPVGTVQPGRASLQLQALGPAQGLVVGPGAVSIGGTGAVSLSSAGSIRGQGVGNLAVAGDLQLQAQQLQGETASQANWSATGRIELLPATPGSSVNDPVVYPPGLGASLTLTGSALRVDGTIALPSGAPVGGRRPPGFRQHPAAHSGRGCAHRRCTRPGRAGTRSPHRCQRRRRGQRRQFGRSVANGQCATGGRAARPQHRTRPGRALEYRRRAATGSEHPRAAIADTRRSGRTVQRCGAGARAHGRLAAGCRADPGCAAPGLAGRCRHHQHQRAASGQR
jgi:hypothetical protein